MKCKSCATSLAEGALFCHKCGSKVEKGCHSCGKELIEGAVFCPFCGTRVSEVSEVIEEKNIEQPDFVQANKEEKLSDEIEDYFANNKSYYIGVDSKDFNRMNYQGRIYFLSKSDNEIWSMHGDGTELERVVFRHKDDENGFIGVNRRGIFTYSDYGSNIYQYSFLGDLLNIVEVKLKDYQVIRDLFIYDDTIYYIIADEMFEEGQKLKQTLNSVKIDGSQDFVIYKGTSKTDIKRVLAYKNYVLFYVEFFSNDERAEGWYKYDINTREVVNLNSTILPPDAILKYPKKFDYDSRSYVEDLDRVEIFSFDLINEIMWTFPSSSECKKMNLVNREEGKLLLPRKIGIGPNEPILDDEDPWTLPEYRYPGTSYSYYVFNGDYLFYPESYYRFYGVDREGNLSGEWVQDLHGRTETMQITGQYLIGDLYAYYRYDSIYPLSYEKPDKDEIADVDWETPYILDRSKLQKIISGEAERYNSSKKLIISGDISEDDISALRYSETFFMRFEDIEIDEENNNFVVQDGILFNKDKTKLIRYIGDSYGKNIELPESVVELGAYSLYNKRFNILVLSNNIRKIGERAFQLDSMSNIKDDEHIINCEIKSYAYEHIRENYKGLKIESTGI